MRKLRKYIVTNKFKDFLPEQTDFEIVEEEIPALKKGEFLVKSEYISVDPYMRSFASRKTVPYAQFGFQVGKVIESENEEFPVDKYVVSHSGWSDFVVLSNNPDNMFNMKPYEPPIGNLPVSLSVGALGMPGITAYLGFLEICKPKKGDIVCVTSAGGAVGSIVAQIALLKGCTVIGLTGSDHKVNVLKQELGLNHAFNYKTENIKDSLNSVAPNGIDCYFDNVGGTLADSVMECLKEHGRVAICGSISTYGSAEAECCKGKCPLHQMESFSFTQWDKTTQLHAITKLREWIENGSIKAKETITNGFEELPHAFVQMLRGENIGKAVVKI